MPLGCLSVWESQRGNIYALCLFIKEMIICRLDLWTYQQRDIWSYRGTSFTTTFTAASSGAVRQPAHLQCHSEHVRCDRTVLHTVLPFTVAVLAKLLWKDNPSPALNPICSEQFSPLSFIIISPSTGFICCNSSYWKTSLVSSYLWPHSFAPLCSKTLWVITTHCLPQLSSSASLTQPARLSSHNPAETHLVQVTRDLHVT